MVGASLGRAARNGRADSFCRLLVARARLALAISGRYGGNGSVLLRFARAPRAAFCYHW